LGELSVRGQVRYQSSNWVGIQNTSKNPSQTYVNIDAQLSSKDKRWTLFGNIANLTNKAYVLLSSGDGIPGIRSAVYSQPRSFEVGLRHAF
jgi:outer membrane receptor protein involved in Fe transport